MTSPPPPFTLALRMDVEGARAEFEGIASEPDDRPSAARWPTRSGRASRSSGWRGGISRSRNCRSAAGVVETVA